MWQQTILREAIARRALEITLSERKSRRVNRSTPQHKGWDTRRAKA